MTKIVIAKAGEALTDVDGTYICRLKEDMTQEGNETRYVLHDFPDEQARSRFVENQDLRGRRISGGISQFCIEGEWRP